jgi:hypothetical protein
VHDIERTRREGKSMTKDEKVTELYELIEDIEIAMMTTRRSDGRLVSRPMATQKRATGADLWFVTSTETELEGVVPRRRREVRHAAGPAHRADRRRHRFGDVSEDGQAATCAVLRGGEGHDHR